jgi:hypothetical protein
MKIEHFILKLASCDLILVTGIDNKFNNFELFANNKNHLLLRYRKDNIAENYDNELYWVAQLKLENADYKIIDANFTLDSKIELPAAWDLNYRIKEKNIPLREKTIIIEQISVDNFVSKHNDLEKYIRALYQVEFENVFDIFLQKLIELARGKFDPNYFVKVWNMAHDLYIEDTINRSEKLNKITRAILKHTKDKIEEKEEVINFGH